MQDRIMKVIQCMLAMQRYPWEQGVCSQALFEAGREELWIPMAYDVIRRQLPDGRLAMAGGGPAVSDPAADGRFHDILDDPDSFPDGTSSAMMAATVFRGILHGYVRESYRPAAEAAFRIVMEKTDEWGWSVKCAGARISFPKALRRKHRQLLLWRTPGTGKRTRLSYETGHGRGKQPRSLSPG